MPEQWMRDAANEISVCSGCEDNYVAIIAKHAPAVDVEALAEKIHIAIYGNVPLVVKDEIADVLRKELT